MRRLSTMAVAVALLLVGACSSPASPPALEAAPRPVISVSPSPPQAQASKATPANSSPAPKPPSIPVTGTDPAQLLPDQASVPVKLEVGRLDISMDVVPVGVDDRGDMELPPSVSRVGWYEFGSRPSESAGATVLAAHVDSFKDGLGPFARLRSARKGTKIMVTTHDGMTHAYRVSSVERLAKSTLPLTELFERDGQPTLTLITCGGAYSRSSGYSDNVVVTAQPV